MTWFLGSDPNIVTLDRLEVEVQLMPLLSSEVKVNRLILVGANILLETDPSGTPNWQFDTAAPAEEESASDAGGESILPQVSVVAIENSRLTYLDGVTGASQVVGLDNIQLSESGANLYVILNGSYQETPFDLSGSVGSVESLMSGGSYPVDLSGQVAGADLSVNGTVDSVMTDPVPDLTISASGASFADFSAMAGSDLPDMGEYAFDGQVTKDGNAITINGFTFTLGANAISGDLSADTSGAVPYVNASLTTDTLDLTALSAGEGGGDEAAASGGGDSQYVIPDTPLPLDGLRSANADLAVTIGKLILQEGMEVDNIDLTLSLQGGKLSISPLQALFSGGQIDLNTTLDASQQTAAMQTALNIAGLDYGQLMRSTGAGDNVEGTADIAINVSGVGNSPRQIASSLNGSSEILGNEGVITNKLLAVILSGLGEVMGELMGGDDKAALNCLISRFDIVDGNMSSLAMALNTDTFSVAGKGSINLKTEALNLAFDTATSEASIASLAVPFTVTGTMKNPHIGGAALDAMTGGGDIGNTLGALTGGALGGSSDAGGEQQADNPCAVSTGESAQPAAVEEPSLLDSVVPDEVQGVTDSVGEGAGDAVDSIGEGVGDAVEGLFGN